MIKTLRITSIIVAIATVVLLILPVVYGVRKDSKIEDFLKKPGVVEKFTATNGQNATKNDNQNSPLVKQAMDLSKYFNPPPPPQPKPQPGAPAPSTAQAPAPQGPVSVKFDLVATSYYASSPEKSFALIDEAGKGLHWVKQGSTIGHVTIDTIKDGAVVVRDGTRTFEMTVKVKETWRGLLKNPPPSTRAISTSTSPAAVTPAVQAPVSPAIQPSTVSQGTESTIPSPTGINNRQIPPSMLNRRGARPAITPPISGRITSPAPPAINPPPQPVPGNVEEPTPAVEQPSPVQPAPVPEVAQPQPEEKPAREDSPAVKEKAAKIDKLLSEIDPSKMTKDEEKKMNEMFKEIEELGNMKEAEAANDVNK
jgi:hypothetical protein